tara:strand:- start:8000 stop:8194 length:195 start_codon:yes stop_codon:yes gene_type:complete
MNEQIYKGLATIYRGLTLRHDPNVLAAREWIREVAEEWEQGKVKTDARPVDADISVSDKSERKE